MSDKSLHQKLMDIQEQLKVPKDQNNDFGGFKYRSIESIEEKVKPLLKQHDLVMMFNDEVVSIGDRVYVKANCLLTDGENTITTTAYAREAITPKSKMDDAQLTGSCSSYARKYAVGGLFLIDDTKDADSHDNSQKPLKKAQDRPKLVTAIEKQQLKNTMSALGMNQEAMTDTIKDALGKDKVETAEDFHKVVEYLEAL